MSFNVSHDSVQLLLYNEEDDIDGNMYQQILQIYIDNFEKDVRVPIKEIEWRIKNLYDVQLLVINNVVVAFCYVVRFRKHHFIFIDYIAVSKNYQGKGYGKLLFNRINEIYITAHGETDHLVLECEDNLVLMYTKWGCRKIPINYDLKLGHHLNLMVKGSTDKQYKHYHKFCRELIKLNIDQFSQKPIKDESSLGLSTDKYIFTIINYILRETYGNSRIYSNFGEGDYYALDNIA